jgi:hypothetical protein
LKFDDDARRAFPGHLYYLQGERNTMRPRKSSPGKINYDRATIFAFEWLLC